MGTPNGTSQFYGLFRCATNLVRSPSDLGILSGIYTRYTMAACITGVPGLEVAFCLVISVQLGLTLRIVKEGKRMPDEIPVITPEAMTAFYYPLRRALRSVAALEYELGYYM